MISSTISGWAKSWFKSLHARLLLGIALVLLAGLASVSIASYSLMNNFLLGRLDSEVSLAERQGYAYLSYTFIHSVSDGNKVAVSSPSKWLSHIENPAPTFTLPNPTSSTEALHRAIGHDHSVQSSNRLLYPSGHELTSKVGPDLYIEVLSEQHRLLYSSPSGTVFNPDPPPSIPAKLDVRAYPHVYTANEAKAAYKPSANSFEAGASGVSGVYYRGQAIQIPGGILVVMAPLASVHATLSDLVHVELLVSLIVLLLMIVISFWVVRIGLAPLNGIREAADEIAGGNLGRRISVGEENTEVGSLAVALNGMLDQIELSFRESSLAQDRLRQFMADVSHELRTPLTSIRGYAQLLGKGALSDPDDRDQAVGRINDEAQRMTLLVNDLMLLARLDQDRPIDAADTDMHAIVVDAVNAAQAVYPDREIDIIAQGDTIVFGDAERLRQIVDNLLHNAAVHTPSGTPIHVSLVESSGSLVLSVIDEGYGLSPSELQEVFDRFHKGHQMGKSHGMGLGLSIVAAIAVAHGGRAWAESPVWTGREGSEPSSERLPGAAFRVAIPIRHHRAQQERKPLL